MSAANIWTLKEIEQVQEMFKAGCNDTTIAKHIGRSRESVRHIRMRYDITYTHYQTELRQGKTAEKDCVMHLIDLMKSYGCDTLGEAKAQYRANNELDVLPGYVDVTHTVSPYRVDQSFIGSQFAD